MIGFGLQRHYVLYVQGSREVLEHLKKQKDSN